ncbi:MAG: Signal transduction histidine kinase [Candidatus Midichloria mitochondrii]|nr:ATP-binding protein [Candidatus Midichloria mitochondrii]MDJ1256073.1 ATP-binding protein [Candidatus Midichloria mitochondrii]MDJ1287771.1 ATP-binding protein [Candidatus Midichloria mitochondrii]MDJ1298739.1 ATP-binding protein [Candidatus Midichloria mitochondrii]MDJ1312621.1 ATP-binding protein [Candidatus Midichloria mitochondrii]MDJ1583229.1 ATP-binding protein [Candidatus Midichloria mitochondrii]
MGSLGLVDGVVVFVYITGYLATTFYKARSINNEYSINDHSIWRDVVAVSAMLAVSISTVTIGAMENIYLYGLFFAIPRIVAPLSWLLILKVYAERTGEFKGCLSISDIMQRLYGVPGRWVTDIATVLFGKGMVACQLAALGYIFSYFFDLSYGLSITVGFFLLTLYSIIDKAKQVEFIKVSHLCIFLVALPMACYTAYHDEYKTLTSSAHASLFKLDLNLSNIWVFLSLVLYSMVPAAESIHVQRFLMAYNRIRLIKSLKIVMAVAIPFTVLTCIIAFLIKAQSPDLEPKFAFMHFISSYTSAGIEGLVLVGLIAIIMSSASSWLSYAGLVCTENIIKKIFPDLTVRQELSVLYTSTFAITILSTLLALSKSNIFSLLWMADNFWQPVILVPLAAGFLGFRANSLSFVISTILAIFFILAGRSITGEFSIISLTLGILGSGVSLFAVHYLQKYGEKRYGHEQLEIFNIVSRRKIEKIYGVIAQFMKSQIEKSGTKSHSFCLFIAVNYFMPLIVVNVTGNVLHDSIIYLRVISILLCLILLFAEYWTRKSKNRYYALYWYFCLFFCIPFTASYTIFVTYTSGFWLLNAILSIILLFIITDWISFGILMLSGPFVGYLLYTSLSHQVYPHYSHSGDILLLFYLYGFLLIIMFLFIRDKEKIQEKRLEHMELFGGAIAHEVNTPIATIQMIAMTLSDLAATSSKEVVKKEQPDGSINYVLTIPEAEYEMIFESLPYDLVKTSKEAKRVVDVLLMLLRHRGTEYGSVYSMVEVIQEVLDDYMLEAEKKNRIILKQVNDFKFFGTKQYMKQVLKNLINNSFKYAGEDAKITILVEGNSLCVRDNGIGIEPEYMKNLFKPFHEKGTKGTGIGLAFCGILIHNMGGTIECNSEYGKYTEFLITLPVAK